jgi:hypothetical protein
MHGTTREVPLTRFAQVEKPLLRPLPDVAPELAEWARLIVNRTAHVQHARCLYSVPHVLVGKTVWVRATATTVKAFHEHQLVATHPRLHRPGQRSTVADHLPPDARAWSLATAEWCQQQAALVGPSCSALVTQMLADPVLERLRAVQATLRLRERYGPQRLEAACKRAVAFGTYTFRSIKTILANGLDQVDAAAAFDQTADLYARGGRFLRTPGSSVMH